MMSRDNNNNITDEVKGSVDKVPLRTYSRHGRLNKRSYSTLPEVLPDSVIKADSNGARFRGAQLGLPERKRRRNTTSSGKTLTELFWEQLSSSAPTYTRPLETSHLELGISIKHEDNVAMIENPTHSVDDDDCLPATHVDHKPSSSLGQRPHNISSEATVPQIIIQNSIRSEKPDNDEDCSQPRLSDEQGLERTSVSRSKLRKFLRLSPPRSSKKSARRTLDVDESLSVVESASASGAPIDTVPTARHKSSDHQAFRKLEFTKEIKVKRSSDGFERDEARTGGLGRRRRMDSIDHNIGSLELTHQSFPAQKLEGPTWGRGQKKAQVSTTKKPWNKRQHLNNPRFQTDFEEDLEPVQPKHSNPDDQAVRGIWKRRSSQIISNDDDEDKQEQDELMKFTVPAFATKENNTCSGAKIATVRTSRAKHGKECTHISDADEPVVLLASPADDEDEASYISDGDESVILLVSTGNSDDDAALATIPRTDTPEHGADFEETSGQLPPKEWTLNVLDYDGDALALRPDAREWTR